ncbi:hypothetical protein [Neorhodopirellula lusitana]|uniref:hypothetical protein n=1 Tax=Neorhodopirellula lusitana TaxID=445327 RepID=UPI0024B6FE2D|nr:hypothetical protein [Neorhodopirellula lusitana]
MHDSQSFSLTSNRAVATIAAPVTPFATLDEWERVQLTGCAVSTKEIRAVPLGEQP